MDEIYQQNTEIKSLFEEFKNSFGNIAAVNNISRVATELLDLKASFLWYQFIIWCREMHDRW